jgi:hypothetical protein
LVTKLSKADFVDLTHTELVTKLENGIRQGTNSVKSVKVTIVHITLSGTFGGFAQGTLENDKIIAALAEMMSLAKSAVTIKYGGSKFTHSSKSGGRRLAQSVDYEGKVVKSNNNDVVANAQAAMKSISTANLQTNLENQGVDTSKMTLTEESTPEVSVKTEAVVESPEAPNLKGIAEKVDEATGGKTEEVRSGNNVHVGSTTITTTITTTVAMEDSWAITPMISIWSVLYAMALS